MSITLTVLSEETEKLIDKVDKVEKTHALRNPRGRPRPRGHLKRKRQQKGTSNY
jgi:hypothetical protein